MSEAQTAREAITTAIGACVDAEAQNPDFCGAVIDEMRGDDGKLLALRIVFCDSVGGNPARRLGIEQ